MISFCKDTIFLFKNLSSFNITQLSYAESYNKTFGFAEIFINMKYIDSNGTFEFFDNFTSEIKETTKMINFRKTTDYTNRLTCYTIQHLKPVNHKRGTIYQFYLYHFRQDLKELAEYHLFL